MTINEAIEKLEFIRDTFGGERPVCVWVRGGELTLEHCGVSNRFGAGAVFFPEYELDFSEQALARMPKDGED